MSVRVCSRGVVVVLAVFAGFGCATKPPETAAAASTPATTANAEGAGRALGQSAVIAIAPGSARDFAENVGDRVHFDFDRADLDQNDRAILQRQADWLRRYAAARLVVEGHADERGTREYNLALGARRAAAIRLYLASLGVDSARIETVSYGKERPECAASAESCWAQNRRGVSVVRALPAA